MTSAVEKKETEDFSIGEIWVYMIVMTVAGLSGLTLLFTMF